MASRFLTPYSRSQLPADPVTSLHREVNRLFNDMFNIGGFAPGVSGGLMTAPVLDVRENEQELCVTVELPGVKRTDVDVRLEGDVLILSGEKKSELDEQRENLHVSERSYGRFQRAIQLPFRPDPQQVEAAFENGVLEVHLRKPAESQGSRRIEVRGSGAQQALGEQSSSRTGQPGTSQAGAPASSTQAGAAGAGSTPPSTDDDST